MQFVREKKMKEEEAKRTSNSDHYSPEDGYSPSSARKLNRPTDTLHHLTRWMDSIHTPCSVAALSFFTCYWAFSGPATDLKTSEPLFIPHVHMYMNRTFFFDTNPPFATQFFTVFAVLDFLTDFQSEKYRADADGCLYGIPVALGCCCVVLAFTIMRQLRYGYSASIATALWVLFDKQLITESREVSSGIIHITLVMTTMLAVLKLIHRPASSSSRYLRILIGVLLGCGISCRYDFLPMAVFTVFLVMHQFWVSLGDAAAVDDGREVIKRVVANFSMLFAIPVLIYVSSVCIHLTWLTKAGTFANGASVRLQLSLDGGVDSLLHQQPIRIAHGSQISLRGVSASTGHECWLHSHKTLYPEVYEDSDRRSSHQQQVTCYGFKDINNWFIVKKPPGMKTLEAGRPVDVVRSGDVIDLVHGMTGKLLRTINISAPLTTHCQEVSALDGSNVTSFSNESWRVLVTNTENEEDDVWSLKSTVRLTSTVTRYVLNVPGKELPSWGHHQQEVGACAAADAENSGAKPESSEWTVEEHRYTDDPVCPEEGEREYDLKKAPSIPRNEAIQLSRWEKFYEYHKSFEHHFGQEVDRDHSTVFQCASGSDKRISSCSNGTTIRAVTSDKSVMSLLTGMLIVCLSLVGLAVPMELWRLRYPHTFPLSQPEYSRAVQNIGTMSIGWILTAVHRFVCHEDDRSSRSPIDNIFKYFVIGCFVGELFRLSSQSRSRAFAENMIRTALLVWLSCVAVN